MWARLCARLVVAWLAGATSVAVDAAVCTKDEAAAAAAGAEEAKVIAPPLPSDVA